MNTSIPTPAAPLAPSLRAPGLGPADGPRAVNVVHRDPARVCGDDLASIGRAGSATPVIPVIHSADRDRQTLGERAPAFGSDQVLELAHGRMIEHFVTYYNSSDCHNSGIPFSSLTSYHPSMIEKRAKIVGGRIKEARTRRQRRGLPWTQAWLAEKVNVQTRAISNYEIGIREPRLEMLGQLAAALEVSPLWLGAFDLDEKYDRRLDRLIELWSAHDNRTRDMIFRLAEISPDYRESGTKRLKEGGKK